VDTQFVNTLADASCVTEVAQAEARNSLANTISAGTIPKPTQPLCEWLAAIRSGVDANILLDRHLGIVA